MLTNLRKEYYAILAFMILPLGGMSTDIYLPSLPAITDHFHIIKALSQLTVTAYALALGLSQLVAGPLSDAIGRKRMLLTATSVQLLSVIAIIFSFNIYWMIAFRFIQGLGAAFMMVPVRAILNDCFTGDDLKKKFNYAVISFAIGPIIAPFIGGYLQHYFNWRANFYFILIYLVIAIVLLLTTFRETLASKRPFMVSHLRENYTHILKNKYFLLIAIFIGLLWGYVPLFNVAGPFLIQVDLGRSPIVYGHIALLMGFGWFLGSTANRLLFRFDINIKTKVATALTLITVIVMLIYSLSGYFNLTLIIVPTFLAIMFSGSVFSIYVAEGMTLFPEMAGSANAVLFTLIWIAFSIFTLIATLLKSTTLLPYSLTFLCVCLLCLLVYYLAILRHEKKHRDSLGV